MSTVVFDRLLLVTSLLQADQERELAARGLTTARTHVLWVLHHTGPSSQRVLADAVGSTPRNITALVDALVADGFVTREPHPTDRRAVQVTLTVRATSIMSEMALEHASLAASLVEGLTAAEVAALDRGLEHVTNRLESLIAAHAATAPATQGVQ